MLSRAASDSHWISATLAKVSLSKPVSSAGTEKVARSKVGWVGVVGHHHHFVFSQKLLDAQGCVGGGIVMVLEPIPTLPLFWMISSQALVQFFQHIHVKLLIYCVMEKQTPCALCHQHQKKKSTLSWNWSERAALFLVWVNLVTSANLTAALTQGHSCSTNSHHLLQLLWETEGPLWALPENHGKSWILQQQAS